MLLLLEDWKIMNLCKQIYTNIHTSLNGTEVEHKDVNFI